MKDKVIEIVDRKVRPLLESHHGDIEVVAVKENLVEVKLLGACSGCPSAKATLEDVVLAGIQEDLPQIQEVVLVTDISEDLLSMARDILNKRM